MTLIQSPRRSDRSGLTAADAMTSPGPQIGDDMTVDVALSVLISSRVQRLLVHDEDGRHIGSITQAQLTAHRSGAWYTEHGRLRDIAHDVGPFTSPGTPLRDADSAMRDRKQEASPVIDDEGYLLGVLTLNR